MRGTSNQRNAPLHRLPAGVIVEIVERGGVKLKGSGPRYSLRCCLPDHDDRQPSAVIDHDKNNYKCFGCGAFLSAKQLAGVLGVAWPVNSTHGLNSTKQASGRTSAPCSRTNREFTPQDARVVWDHSLARAFDDSAVESDRCVYDYLSDRGLLEAWECRAFGVLHPDLGPTLPHGVRWWPSKGYRIVAPLYDSAGLVVGIQARSILRNEPKTLFPRGCHVRGTAFANSLGLRVLRGEWKGTPTVIIGEGMTDCFALSAASPVPVFTAPGAGMAAALVGPWVSGFRVYLALDNDPSGQDQIPPAAEQLGRHGAFAAFGIRWPDGANDAAEVAEKFGVDHLADFLQEILRSPSDGEPNVA